MTVHHVGMEYERETRRKYRFREIVDGDGPPVIGTMYVSKEAFKERPNIIQIDLSVVEHQDGWEEVDE